VPFGARPGQAQAKQRSALIDFGPPHCGQHPQRSPFTAERPHLAHRNVLVVIR